MNSNFIGFEKWNLILSDFKNLDLNIQNEKENLI